MKPIALCIISLGLSLPPTAVGSPHRPGNVQTTARAVRRAATAQSRPKLAAGMAPQRAKQIQRALVRAGYLNHISGIWDSTSAAAMKKLQKDRHWQTKYVPDARALIALGLGPSLAIALAAARRP